jgi:hypothetical protein
VEKVGWPIADVVALISREIFGAIAVRDLVIVEGKRALASYFLAFVWGILILLSLIGWGGVLNRLLFPKEETSWGQRAAWGMAFSVVVGGVLNFLSCISRTTILVYLGLGMVAWLIGSIARRGSLPKSVSQPMPDVRKPKILLAVGVFAVISLALIRYAASVSVVRCDWVAVGLPVTRFFVTDDFQSYAVFPEKMVQMGSMGRDPFNERRLESSLGGQSFLHTFVLSMLSVQNLHIIDPGLGLIVIIGLLWGIFKERGISPVWSLSILVLFLLMDPPPNNITSLYTGSALFLSLYCTLAWKAFPTSRFVSRILIIALLAAAICSLKSNFIPACGVLLACSFLCYVIGQNFGRGAIAELVGVAILIVAFMFPWMISMYQSSGTLLYPLLGKGYHQSVYGNALSAYSGLTVFQSARLILHSLKGAPFLALVSLGATYLASRKRRIGGREPVLSLLLGATLGLVVITVATQGAASYRYSFAFVLVAILVLMIETSSSRREGAGQNTWEASAPFFAAGVAFFLVGSAWANAWIIYGDSFPGIKLGLAGVPLIPVQQYAEYQRLQQSIPAGKVVLARLEKPILLDFKRNTVYVLDWAVASPPPGMPLFQGSEALARYLASQSIRYVAYSYSNPETSFGPRFSDAVMSGWGPWVVTDLRNTYDFQDNLAELGRTRRRIYDDGKNFVLDLLQPSSLSGAQGSGNKAKGKWDGVPPVEEMSLASVAKEFGGRSVFSWQW